MSGPLRRRYDALASLDEDTAEDWTPSQRQRFIDGARQAAAQRDRAQVEQGQRILADYLGPGVTYRDAFRAYLADLLGGSA